MSHKKVTETKSPEYLQQELVILETIPDAIIITDENGIIEIFNLAAEPLFQYTDEEVIGQHISLLFAELDVKQKIQANVTTELTAVRKGGETFPAEFSVGNMRLQGRKISACVVRDISDRIHAEREAILARDQLIEAEKMASLGGLVAGVAHEINTPVGIGVTAASHLRERYLILKEEYDSGALRKPSLESFMDTCAEATRILESNLQRASVLIHSFKQIAVDQSSGDKRRFNVKEYLDELILSMHPEIKKTKLTVQLDCDDALWINSYPGAISQILTNFIINSIIHGFDSPATGTLLISFCEREKQYELVFADDGKGIEEKVLQRIFEPFFTTRRGQGSSGLGLHICYNLVKQTLAGHIECKSGVGEGTRFTISLPKQTI
ncbi:MAG: PAS domain S-box protein [Gammaproteobacteria bacterium]|nr:PAS domain S-box protein [Gammaproteobacteria bacterium]